LGTGRQRLFDAYSRISVPLIFRGARRLIAVSLDHAVHCRLAPLFQAREQEVVEIPNGVDTDLFRPGLEAAAIRRQWQIPLQARVILFVGALDRAHHFKGVDYLLRLLAELNEPETVLMLVGDGDLKSQYLELACQLGFAGRCASGAVAPDRLPWFYAAADLVVLPSFPESFGMVLIEPLACGRPVIAPGYPWGPLSVVSHGVDGF
jgi:D-inositol-3-phosphate glycosyltransferase